ncbi:MAG: hypothetical protein JSS91_07645 [Bacteroidetes bacterium]|nr:hypothetical protein [Bacteroidota bacterium]
MKNLHNVITIFCMMLILGTVSELKSQDINSVYGSSVSDDNSKIVSVDFPESLKPGEEYAASITFLNTGKNTWSNDKNYMLSLYVESDNKYMSDVWGIKNIAVPKEIHPGEKAILLFKITAPYKEGIYNSRWAMTKDNNYFGEYTVNVIKVGGVSESVNYKMDGNESKFINISVPGSMNADEKYKVSVTIENTGIYPWNSFEGYTLAPVTEPSGILYPDWNTTPVSLSSTIENGQTSSIEFYVTAPSVPGNYTLQYMMKKGDSYFGQISDKINVIVTGKGSSESATGTNNSIFVKLQIPDRLKLNTEEDVSVTIANTGNKAWIKGNEALVMVDGKLNQVTMNSFGIGYIQLPENVQPGEVVTFNFKVKPTETGWQHFQMMMMNKDGSLFGASTEAVEIIVVP